MKDEKIARTLRVIAYLLCAILLMEVILFAGITAFASGENVLVYGDFVLNMRIRSNGQITEDTGGFITNYIDIHNQSILYFKGLDQSNFNNVYVQYSLNGVLSTVYASINNNVFIDGDLIYILLGVDQNGDPLKDDYDTIRVGVRFFKDTFLTINDVQSVKANFTGDFTDQETDNKSILSLYGDFTHCIPNIITNLANLLYDENGLTVIGTALCVMGGTGTVFAIIKIILKSLKGGK